MARGRKASSTLAVAKSSRVEVAAATGGLDAPSAGGQSRTTKKKKAARPAASFELLQEICTAEKGVHLKAKKTMEAYKGHTKRGFEFLAILTSSLRQTPGKSQPLWRAHGSFDIDEFERAFHGLPNRYSVTALESFLVEKCLNQGLGVSTADGIHAAFKRLWDEMYAPLSSRFSNDLLIIIIPLSPDRLKGRHLLTGLLQLRSCHWRRNRQPSPFERHTRHHEDHQEQESCRGRDAESRRRNNDRKHEGGLRLVGNSCPGRSRDQGDDTGGKKPSHAASPDACVHGNRIHVMDTVSFKCRAAPDPHNCTY